MTLTHPTLHMLCGKMASGKSTLARTLSAEPATLCICEDDWLAALYRDQLHTLPDYVRCSSKLRDAMTPHVVSLLAAGQSVVLDFAANTVRQRAWLHEIIAQTKADPVMHVIEASDALCLKRLSERNAKGAHPFAPTEAQFREFTRFFVPPSPQEGFQIRLHRATAPKAGFQAP